MPISLAIDAENIQRSLNIARQGGVFVEFTNSVDDLLGAGGATGVELQQPVAARVVFRQFGAKHRAGFGDDLVKCLIIQQRVSQGVAKGIKQVVAHPVRRTECVHAFVVPAQQALAGAAFKGWNMQFDGVALADTIQAANALFELVRMLGHIEHHQVATELEVASLRADFRAHQYLDTLIFIGKGRRRAVTLYQREVFMEHRGVVTA
ncbi:hypothetical protein HSBAA_02670 [Vreelandella sulfidaeris]|uniref:Uncharacterized protein n=1 Tax=Vreelandella sulfidaeris TaxID=115553 RepID=A0A455U3B5_9GAMM|nr:hypothetical protein HSBAA_02670 [Halomonas sulfidaeris]